jgi:hypothetical protein
MSGVGVNRHRGQLANVRAVDGRQQGLSRVVD